MAQAATGYSAACKAGQHQAKMASHTFLHVACMQHATEHRVKQYNNIIQEGTSQNYRLKTGKQ